MNSLENNECTQNKKGKNNIDNESIENKQIDEDSPLIYIEQEEDPIELKEKREEELKKRLEYYGITAEEWEAVKRYKGSAYFIITTLLHRVDLFNYNFPAYGELFQHLDLVSFESATDIFCKIYSVMCKFAKRNNKEIQINRVGSSLFYEEMEKTGQTQSFLSFSNGRYHWGFANDKNGVILSKGVLEKGIPCIEFSAILGEDVEDEVLIPPFLNINYKKEVEKEEEIYPEYIVNVSKNKIQRLTIEEKEKMGLLREAIIEAKAPYEYYTHWYNMRANPINKGDDEKSEELKEEFFKWQDLFKEYLQLKFREIEYEINYPKVKSMDFLSWGIEREKSTTFRNAMHKIKKIFDRMVIPERKGNRGDGRE